MNTQYPTLQVFVRNRESVTFKGEALAVTSYNDQGIFDILPQHSNFISMIKNNITIHKIDQTKEEFAIQSGVMKVANNSVTVYIGQLQPLKSTPVASPAKNS